jgi:hypothetical protein
MRTPCFNPVKPRGGARGDWERCFADKPGVEHGGIDQYQTNSAPALRLPNANLTAHRLNQLG